MHDIFIYLLYFFLDLLSAIRDNVDYDLVTDASTPEDALLNAKYAISLARKRGCCIFLLPEDIVEVKPKMILTLIGTIMAVALSMSAASVSPGGMICVPHM